MSHPYLQITHLNKSFGAFQALRDISLSVEAGEFVCFLGPSGCGKTTLLRAIAGLELPDNGRIIQQDRDITWLPPEQRDFGVVFQSYALFPNLTVAQNIAFGLENRRLPKAHIQETVLKWLDLTGLREHSHKYPAQISGGQQQRVALARALALSPGLLLLDEPLSALDAQVRTHLRTEIRALQQRLGITTIMVTHDQEEALSMADRIVVMEQGQISQSGSARDIYQRPSSQFVARFVGSMNFLECMVISPRQIRLNTHPLTLANRGQTGSRLCIALRPESIQLHPAEAGALPAVITQIEFLGSQLRLFCQAETYFGPQTIQVLAPFASAAHWRSGMRCSLSWPDNAMQAFEGAPRVQESAA